MGVIKHKIIVVGAPAVGKTSLVKNYTKGEFVKEYISTLGAQFSRFEETIENDTVELIIWDIAGQETYETMRKKFYVGSSGCIVVFSHAPDERKTLSEIDKWVNEVRSNNGEIPMILLGNKIDLIDVKELEENNTLENSDQKVDHIVNLHGFMGYYKTSALTGERVTDAFHSLIHKLYYSSE